ncbi:MAG: hypothetical protein JRJ46_10435 [Deltaproteobacteria bacterium]|nr:hypothetical protein [Deltaproteobacteria bacterium]
MLVQKVLPSTYQKMKPPKMLDNWYLSSSTKVISRAALIRKRYFHIKKLIAQCIADNIL